jgi:hypothetical protein
MSDNVKSPRIEEIEEFLGEISKASKKPMILSLVPHHCDTFVQAQENLPKSF